MLNGRSSHRHKQPPLSLSKANESPQSNRKVGSEYVPLINDSGRLLPTAMKKMHQGKKVPLCSMITDEVAITYKEAKRSPSGNIIVIFRGARQKRD